MPKSISVLISIILLLTLVANSYAQNHSASTHIYNKYWIGGYPSIIAWYEYKKLDEGVLPENILNEHQGLILTVNQADTSTARQSSSRIYSFRGTYEKVLTGYLINNTDLIEQISVQDKSLIMIMEAKDSLGKWRAIERWEGSWVCGHAFGGTLMLDKRESVSFNIPIYNGEIKTEKRLKLRGTDEKFIYSNTFIGYVSKEQLYEMVDYSLNIFWGEGVYLDQDGRPARKN